MHGHTIVWCWCRPTVTLDEEAKVGSVTYLLASSSVFSSFSGIVTSCCTDLRSSCSSSGWRSRLCGRITVSNSGSFARKAPRITAAFVPVPPEVYTWLPVITIAYDRISTSFWCKNPMLRVPKNPRFFAPLFWMANNSCKSASFYCFWPHTWRRQTETLLIPCITNSAACDVHQHCITNPS